MSEEQLDDATQPADEQLTRIVSYLDGELDDETMNQVETNLVQDPSLREYADRLDRTWHLLDSLEEVSADQSFTQETLATVSAEALQQTQAAPAEPHPVRSFLRLAMTQKAASWILIGCLATGVGLVVSREANRRVPKSDERILENLQMLKNFELYDTVPDLDAFRKLKLKEMTQPRNAAGEVE